MSVPLWNVGGDVLGGRPGHLRDRDGVGEVGCRVARARAGRPDSVVPGRPEQQAGHGRSIAA
ncbi:hypothetical protein [Microbispora amethystogenes]|uniref:hypothetical protein n=1 Tax=Microbispora amethystogenes TaxID=1427754 RepID=UPI0019548604|nr:hypothetical protein [Microbispora amethystogenes]